MGATQSHICQVPEATNWTDADNTTALLSYTAGTLLHRWFRIFTFSILLGSVIGSTTVNEFTESEMTQTVSMTNGVLAVIMYV